MSIVSEATAILQKRNWEIRHPIPGLRHNSKTILIPHRFPVKDGLTWHEAMRWQMYEQVSGFQKLLSTYA